MFSGGNLGNPLSHAVDGAYDVVVAEVSSYQLEWAGTFAPTVGVLLNLTPDHLARHGDMPTYLAIKRRLFQHMERGWAIEPRSLPPGPPLRCRRAWLGDHPGVSRDGHQVHIQLDTSIHLHLDGFDIPGAHNLDNAATAALAVLALGVEPEPVQAALPTCARWLTAWRWWPSTRAWLFINDSKATNLDAVRTGLAGLDRAAVVLLGGQAKGAGFAELVPLLRPHRAVLTFGGSGPEIADELAAAGFSVVRATNLADATRRAAALAKPGDAVLLSPGCASFDAFDDFEHRGRVFADLARRLSTGEHP